MTELLSAANLDGIQFQEQSSAPTDPASGFGRAWLEDTERFSYIFDSGQDLILGGAIFSQTADVVVTNTTDETTLLGTGEGSLTLAADALVVGRAIRVMLRGHLATDASAGTLNIRFKLGGTEVCSTGAVGMTNLMSANRWEAFVDIVLRTTGGSGTVVASGAFAYDGGTTHDAVDTGTTTIDTTGTLALDVTAEWGTADTDNVITTQIAIIEYQM